MVLSTTTRKTERHSTGRTSQRRSWPDADAVVGVAAVGVAVGGAVDIGAPWLRSRVKNSVL
jgi:hypothetical protein